MILTSGVIFGIGWLVLPKVFVDVPVQGSLMLACGVVTSVSLLSLIPVKLLESRGLMPVVGAGFASIALRLVICLATAIYANHVLGMPKFPLVTSLMMFYLPLMGIEMAAISCFVWQKDNIASPIGTKGQKPQVNETKKANVAEVTA